MKKTIIIEVSGKERSEMDEALNVVLEKIKAGETYGIDDSKGYRDYFFRVTEADGRTE